MIIALPPALRQPVERLFHTGCYASESEVLRFMEHQEFDESPALETSLLEGVRSPHRTYGTTVLDQIRQSSPA